MKTYTLAKILWALPQTRRGLNIANDLTRQIEARRLNPLAITEQQLETILKTAWRQTDARDPD